VIDLKMHGEIMKLYESSLRGHMLFPSAPLSVIPQPHTSFTICPIILNFLP